MCLVDLHLRTTASDGTLTPEAVFKYVRRTGIELFSIADRDLPQWIDVPADLSRNYLPGISVRTQAGEQAVDLFVYGRIDPRSQLAATLAEQRARRAGRVRETVFRLLTEGVVITYEDVIREAGTDCHSVTRLHIARALIANQTVRTEQEAFKRYMGQNAPCYVPFERMTLADAMDLVHAAGAVSVAAEKFKLPGPQRVSQDFFNELCRYAVALTR